ncbi:hypothetical protein AGABI2DRAFT_114324 [Agaricus bisporus var. bisporus H97]|uniref:hypothetical protein n=1 Tax=Agaricus bisporus var. bisporus (strain H97 / ATCC MYA-4626 / FGSC 10389) TaxID=936046 RepID=UPI00029F6E98|nr:hypothetical protein AGABI2DRAFT_114324 [Agaricus bisporus var. bisporus H97]EKV51599.1 hypothetical protein AGABI2DRAFT_114324 [Agaricus bisporus var. bisporus H97]
MYSSEMLNSNIYLNPHPNHSFYQINNSYPTFAPRLLSPRDRYHRALAAARSAELEMLEEGARREEAYLERRLQDLRKARIEQLYRNTPNIPYFGDNASTNNLPYKRNQWETSRPWLQEEERLAKLEALYRNLNELEGEIPRAVAAGKYSNFRGMPLIEEVGLWHKLGISKEVDTSHRPPFVTNEASIPITQLGSIPARSFTGSCNIKYSLDQEKPDFLNDLATHLNGERLSSTTPAINHIEQFPKVPFQHHRSHQSQPPTASAQADSGIRSQASVQTQLLSKADNSEQEKHAKHASQASQWLDTTFRDQLKKRLNAEHENEVRDTIEAVLNSLSDIWPASTGPRTSSTSTSRSSIKGKEKANTPSSESKKLSSSDVADNAWLRIEEIEKQFYALEEGFMFPNKLDFVTSNPTTAGSISATSRLSFTANNQTIRFFEHSLGQLLIRLDSIESQGNEELRNKRKDVVQKVEHALEGLEQRVEERLKASESKRRSVTIEDVTSPDEHLGTETVSIPTWTAEKMDNISGSQHPTPAAVLATAKILSTSSIQSPIEEPTTAPNLIAEESVHQNHDSQECTTVASRVEEAVPQITPSDDAMLKAGSSRSKCQPGIPLQPSCSESKEAHILAGRDSDPNNGSVEPIDETRAQELFSTESQAAITAGVPQSTNSDAQTQDETHVTERMRLSDEETLDISDVDSTTSDWSEVYDAVAR